MIVSSGIQLPDQPRLIVPLGRETMNAQRTTDETEMPPMTADSELLTGLSDAGLEALEDEAGEP